MKEQSGGITSYKKYNPNPRPEPRFRNIAPFPEYEEWKAMKEQGTLPSRFDVKPTYDIPQLGATTRGGFEFGTPERIGRAEQFYGLPTETEMPEEMPEITPELAQQALNILADLSGAQIGELEERGFLDVLLGAKPLITEEEEPEPITYPETREEFIKNMHAKGTKASEIAGLVKLLYPEEEEEELTSVDIMELGRQNGFTTKLEYINALMGETGMSYEEAQNFYLAFTVENPGYPEE
jgi:hypothetical protein